MILGLRMRCRIFLDASAADFLDLLHCGQINAVRIIDIAVGIRAGHDLRTEFLCLFDCIGCNIAGAGHHYRLSLQADVLCIQHILHKVQQTIARRLGTSKTSAIGQALACQHRRVVGIADALVLAEQIADLTPADTDIARRNIHMGADMAIELRHEALAELHHFIVGFALRVEIGAALAAADGKSGQRVLEYLLEGKELQDAQVHARMEAQTALVRPDGAVHLHTVAAVDVGLTLVILPRDTEDDNAFRLHHALQYLCLFIFRILLQCRYNRRKHFVHGVLELHLLRIAFFHDIQNILDILLHICHTNRSLPIHVLFSKMICRIDSCNGYHYTTAWFVCPFPSHRNTVYITAALLFLIQKFQKLIVVLFQLAVFIRKLQGREHADPASRKGARLPRNALHMVIHHLRKLLDVLRIAVRTEFISIAKNIYFHAPGLVLWRNRSQLCHLITALCAKLSMELRLNCRKNIPERRVRFLIGQGTIS